MRKALFVHFVLGHYIFILADGCRNDEFECNNTQCINITRRCNLDFDCRDISDELYCDQINVCPEGLYTCNSGQCINAVICDGTKHCADGTDERNCDVTSLYNTFSESRSNSNSLFFTFTTYPTKTFRSAMTTTSDIISALKTSSTLALLTKTFTPDRSVASPTEPLFSSLFTTPKYNYIPYDRGDKDIIIPVTIVVFFALAILLAAIVKTFVYIKRRHSRQQNSGKQTQHFKCKTHNNKYVTTL